MLLFDDYIRSNVPVIDSTFVLIVLSSFVAAVINAALSLP